MISVACFDCDNRAQVAPDPALGRNPQYWACPVCGLIQEVEKTRTKGTDR